MNLPANQILVVEDDPASRSFLEIALTKLGYVVVVAEDAAGAQEQLAPVNLGAFWCVVTDYCMPDCTGLELLGWIQERDASLATILVTAAGEKQLVAESLRSGAADFLDKPVDLKKLQTAVARAIAKTQRQRRMVASASAAKELGRSQERLLGVDATRSPGLVDLCFYPKHEAGGDFFSHFRPVPDQLCCLLTDVSGHDLQAAYISAYFQGLVRGLLTRGASAKTAFADFNRFLLEEWNQTETRSDKSAGAGISVAACAILIDYHTQAATVFTHGAPAPVYLMSDGEARTVGKSGGFPLGWFPELSAGEATIPVADSGVFYVWTDGLEELAEKQGVSVLSLSYALLEAKRGNVSLPCVAIARDDVLLAAIHPVIAGPPTLRFRPLILEQYHGGQAGEIDELQSFWQRSLCLAVPHLSEARLHDILLASREALLNALIHGCRGRQDQTAIFQAACCPQRQTIRVRVSDPGPGHNFDVSRHARPDASGLMEKNLGLYLIKCLANRVDFEHHGASIIMSFDWPSPPQSGNNL